MTKFLKLTCFLLILYSCNQHQNIKYYWITFHGREYENSETIQIIRFDKSRNKDTTKLAYFDKYGSISYFIIKNKDSSFLISIPRDILIHPTDSIVYIRSFYDTSIVLSKDTFRVKKFILDEFVMDGASIHYYEPTLGIYATHSGTWPGLRYLQTTDTSINKQINQLIKATVPKFFIRGQLENKFK